MSEEKLEQEIYTDDDIFRIYQLAWNRGWNRLEPLNKEEVLALLKI